MCNNEKTPKTGMVLQVEATDIFSLPSFLTVFHSFAFGYQCQYWMHEVIPGTLQRLQRQSNSSRMATSIRVIARRLSVSPSTVSRAWRRFQETGSYSRRAGQGRRGP